MRRLRFRRPSHATVVAYVALFVALGLGGTALAAVVINSNSQVAPNTISGHKPPNGKHSNLIAGSVNGQDVANGSLNGADLASSALPKGRAKVSACNPDSTDVADCGAVTINLAQRSRVLIVASAMWFSFPSATGGSGGLCRIGVDGSPFGSNAFPGEETKNSTPNSEHSLTLTNVTGPLAPGSHTFGLACNERFGDIAYSPTYVSAVVLGSG
jgi:hypothetical protein